MDTDKEGYSLRRRQLMKDVLEKISQFTEQKEATFLKDYGLNEADFRFVLDRLFALGLCYFPDCGMHGISDYETSINIAKRHFPKPEDKEALEEEIRLLIKEVTCVIGFPIKIEQNINLCDKNLWIKTVDKITDSHENSYIMHNDELLYVCPLQRESVSETLA